MKIFSPLNPPILKSNTGKQKTMKIKIDKKKKCKKKPTKNNIKKKTKKKPRSKNKT